MSAVMQEMISETVDQRAAYYLTLWVRWEARDDTELGWPSKVCLIATDDRYVSLDDLIDGAENVAAEATDAVVNGLAPNLRLAIRNHYTATVLRWQRRSAGDVLREAHIATMAGLRKRGFT